ncbi:MAG: ribosomal protein S5-alanine N-acetyltransferase [Prochloraceae cyanobacterium]
MALKSIRLETERIMLRLANYKDIGIIIRYYQENSLFLAPVEPKKSDFFYTKNFWYNEIEARLNEYYADRSLKLFLFKQEQPNEIIGVLNFSNFIRGAFQSCNLGYSLAEKEQGKGYMSEALTKAIDYVFTELNLHRIMAAYLPHNQRSGKLLKKMGFLVEGYAYDYLAIDGKWEDFILTSLINPDWQEK